MVFSTAALTAAASTHLLGWKRSRIEESRLHTSSPGACYHRSLRLAHAAFSVSSQIFPPFLSMHVLIAPDKFKGSLTAAQAATALAEGWRQGWPVDKALEIECLPVADGGEGTAEAIHDALAGRW